MRAASASLGIYTSAPTPHPAANPHLLQVSRMENSLNICLSDDSARLTAGGEEGA